MGGLNQEALWKGLGKIAFELDKMEKQLGVSSEKAETGNDECMGIPVSILGECGREAAAFSEKLPKADHAGYDTILKT